MYESVCTAGVLWGNDFGQWIDEGVATRTRFWCYDELYWMIRVTLSTVCLVIVALVQKDLLEHGSIGQVDRGRTKGLAKREFSSCC